MNKKDKVIVDEFEQQNKIIRTLLEIIDKKEKHHKKELELLGFVLDTIKEIRNVRIETLRKMKEK